MLRITSVLTCMIAIPILAQTPTVRPSFEVASIKPNNSNSGNSGTSTNRGRFVGTNVSVKMLLMQAYRVQSFQVIGGPSWIDGERFDIEAKPEEGAIPPQQGPRDPTRIDPMTLMIQSLLEDRFQLKLHRETREMPVYTLSVVKDGPKFKAVDPASRTAPPTPAAGIGPGRVPPPSSLGVGNMSSSINNGVGAMSAGAVPISRLIAFLSQQLGRTVIDKTDLKDAYDIHLEWTRDINPTVATPGTGGAPVLPPGYLPSGPTMFTALQEQLGLKLDSAKGPVEVLLIDSVQRPSEN